MLKTYTVWVGGIEDIRTTNYEIAKAVFWQNLADGYTDAKLCDDYSGEVILEWL